MWVAHVGEVVEEGVMKKRQWRRERCRWRSSGDGRERSRKGITFVSTSTLSAVARYQTTCDELIVSKIRSEQADVEVI